MARAQLLICCSQQEAALIREQAEIQQRTISTYVLRIVMRMVDLDEKLFSQHKRLIGLRPTPKPAPRTTMLVRCSAGEATRIRRSAKNRDSSISQFVLYAVHLAWSV